MSTSWTQGDRASSIQYRYFPPVTEVQDAVASHRIPSLLVASHYPSSHRTASHPTASHPTASHRITSRNSHRPSSSPVVASVVSLLGTRTATILKRSREPVPSPAGQA